MDTAQLPLCQMACSGFLTTYTPKYVEAKKAWLHLAQSSACKVRIIPTA